MRELLIASILGIAAMGCTAETEPGDISEPNVRNVLSEERHFVMDTETSEIAIVADGNWLDGESVVDLPILEGTAVVVAQADELTVTSIDLSFEDIEIGGDGLVGEGDRLSDLTVRLERSTSVETEWDRERVDGAGDFDLTVGWSLRMKGHELDLSDQTIRGLPFEVAVVDESNTLRLEMDASAEGSLWSMPPALEVVRIEISLDGVSAL